VFGNIINGLPIIGPLRKKIVVETKKSLDRSLGPLVQKFLATYTKIAVFEASEFILSPANTKVFASANVRLVSSLMDRSVNSLLPPAEMSDKLKDDAFEYLRNVDTESVERYLGFTYDILGDKSVDSVVDTDRVLDASPTLRRTIDTLWDKAINARLESTEDVPE